MVAPMTPYERAVAAIQNEPVDELASSPLALALCRRLMPQKVTYREWATNPTLCAESFAKGVEHWKFPYTVTLIDLSITASTLGAHVRMDTENTPFVDDHIIHDMEDYDKIVCPDITKGRTGVLIDMNRRLAPMIKGKSFNIAFLEGPLLTLTQAGGAERVFMDMFSDPAPVHKALGETTKLCLETCEKIAETGAEGFCWDYLWGNYACLGDPEYAEFEGDKYAKACNDKVRELGMGLGIHNCADLPHLDTQVKKFGVDMYSMAYYPLIPGSPTAAEVIEQGYGDKCLMMGNIDPQLFVRASTEQITKVTADLCQEVKTALCKKGLNSRYCISSGCEVPPDLETKLENVDAVMAAVHEYGKM